MLTANVSKATCPWRVGDILCTENPTHPATEWPGTRWEQLADTMLYAATANIGATAGQKEITIQAENLPSAIPMEWSASSGVSSVNRLTGSAVQISSTNAAGQASLQTGQQNVPINILNPHRNVYMWKRTA